MNPLVEISQLRGIMNLSPGCGKKKKEKNYTCMVSKIELLPKPYVYLGNLLELWLT